MSTKKGSQLPPTAFYMLITFVTELSYLLLPAIRSGTASTAPVALRTLYIEGQRGQFSIFIIIILANFIISQLLQLCRKGHFQSSSLTIH